LTAFGHPRSRRTTASIEPADDGLDTLGEKIGFPLQRKAQSIGVGPTPIAHGLRPGKNPGAPLSECHSRTADRFAYFN
jgi:hypothetical protein